MPNQAYDLDFYGWANDQASLLRAGTLALADMENIAEEIESMGRGEKRELVNRLTILLLHLLKWKFQRRLRGASWEASIKIPRLQIVDHLADNPSLKSKLAQAIAAAYRVAVVEAAAETGLADSDFPAASPWGFDEMMKSDFWPQ